MRHLSTMLSSFGRVHVRRPVSVYGRSGGFCSRALAFSQIGFLLNLNEIFLKRTLNKDKKREKKTKKTKIKL